MQGEVEQLQQIVAEHGGKLAKLLVGNSISNIAEVLRQTDTKSFTVLDLCTQNELEDASFLAELNLSNIEEINLSSNRIKDIQWLPKLTCPKLERLRINDNLIEDGTPLTTASVRSAHLIEISTIRLESDGNRISDLTFLTKMDFTNLRQFSIAQNPVTDARVLTQVDFKGHPRLKLLLCTVRDYNIGENPLSEESRAVIQSFDQSVGRRIFQYYL